MAQNAALDEDRIPILESRVEDLTHTVEALELRLAALEEGRAAGATAGLARAEAAPRWEDEEEVLASVGDLTGLLGLVGRTLIIFGGAYLLRAVTAAGYLPQEIGVLLAFAYALTWLFLADRTGARGAGASAAFHGATAVLIALPLLWETTARFQYLGPEAAGAALALFVATAGGVAWRRGLHALGWILGIGVPVTALVLLAATHTPAPFGFALVVTGGLGLALYEARGWHGLGWWMGLMGPLGGLLAAFGALAQDRGGEAAALVIGLLLALAYLAAAAYRTLVRKRDAAVFDAAQSGLAVLVGFGGAALVARALGSGALALTGLLGLMLAMAGYWTAFRLVAREQRGKLLLYSTLALAFALAGSGLLLPSPVRAVAWSGLAVLAGWQSIRHSRVTLSLHGAVYCLAAAAASGLLSAATYSFVAPAGTPWPALTPVALLALAAAAVVCALPVPHPAPFWKPYEGLTRALQISVFLWGAAGLVLHLLALALAGGEAPVDAGVLATVRTLVLTLSALLLGWAARWERFREAAWLVYPALFLAALKLVFEDFPQGRPATLFVALAVCGLAFIFAPRLARRAGAASA